ncbi:MAG TPA: DUF4157 domain-containing protein, partial [Longimicrobium sp.]|nr:DUF4157 domain-containing protein [Longimicrobium sp.]
EPRFRHSFADVRVHADARAGESARAVGAHAYAVGRDVVFGAGRYAPGSAQGRRLIAHELAHVVQQRGSSASLQQKLEVGAVDDPAEREAERAADAVLAGGTAPALRAATGVRRLRRAYYDVGGVRVQIDYGNLVNVGSGGAQAQLLVQYAAFTGAAPAPATDAAISALTQPQQVWLMYALDVLIDNTTAVHGALDRVQAVQRLIGAAPSSALVPSAFQPFSEEVLRVSGWWEVALTTGLTAPAAADQARLNVLYNPPSATPPGSTLNVALLDTLLRPALTTFLQARDPANWPSTVAVPLAPIQAAATEIQAIARDFFAPHASRASATPFATGWNYANQIYSVTTTPGTPATSTTPAVPPAPAPVTHDLRVSYLTNRAKMVGNDRTSGPSIFAQVTYDSSVPADRAALETLMTSMANDPAVQPVLDRLIRHTGRTSPATNDVGISTEMRSVPECALRWRTLKTVCHELVHVLAHPRLRARAGTIPADQLVREGFTEVLAVELYNEVRRRAATDPALQTRLEGGVASSPCSPIPPTSLGYEQDGIDALEVQTRAGAANFRAAYFLGALNLVGL